MAKKRFHIGPEQEEYLKRVIAGDAIGDMPPIKAPDTGDATAYPPSGTAEEINVPETVEEKEKAEVAKAAGAQRTQTRRKKSPKEFEDLFLVKRVNTGKRQTYVSEEIYFKMRKYLHVIDCRFSITAYIDNILLHHIEEYKDAINELYDENLKKPL